MEAIHDRYTDLETYHLHTIETKKFKTATIALKFTRPLAREQVTERALLPFILQKGTEKYPSERELRLQLDELYGAKFTINSTKKGENHIITFLLDIANDKFIKDEDQLMQKGLDFLHEVANNPKLIDGVFDQDIVSKEKETLENKIKSIRDEKMQYANMRLIDEMCKEEPFGIHAHGYLDDLEKVTPKTLFESYQKMLHEDRLDVFVVGDIDATHVENNVKQLFTFDREPKVDIVRSEKSVQVTPNHVTEAQKIQQGKLHLGYRTNVTYQDEEYPALQVFNGIFGGFPHSKLFMNVREKHSLAYYAASRFESNKGLLFVFSGIAPEKYEQAKSIIIEQQEEMKKGKITKDELVQTQKAIIHQLKETIDQPRGMVEWYFQQVIGNKSWTSQEMMEAINKVTLEDVIKVANKVQLDTVYFLTAEEGGNDSE
ncbi:EF-P 5-aminopentanol modification-associated protein YfmF [Halalkalibacillus halophilus]|uniref:EF-P 5-aminopentanol modification-associated protein YfmF n=1 Tax=Halalkalibacillus halophilus TaxID=392827 RepID=UPI0003F56CAF|nr:pitrilysin family protein [Halalkalibacillus halophilus]